MDFSFKRVLVVGTGISGIGACNLLTAHGAKVTLFDESKDRDTEQIYNKLLDPEKVEIVLGGLTPSDISRTNMVVLSPGVPTDAPFLQPFYDKKTKVIGEIELGYLFEQGRVIAITGTNGKTTTTTLVGQIMSDYFDKVFVVGNIGNPYTTVVEETTESSITVAEISSFQLETTETFCPKVSAILNVTPDHLNRHYTMENYAHCKEKITVGQTKEEVCVLNYENSYTRDFGDRCPASVVYFSSVQKVKNGYFLDGDKICRDVEGKTEVLMDIHETSLVGNCNYENIMAAIAMGVAMKVPMDSILKTVKKFKAVEHRIEFVATKGGVDYYNDSKGTNPDAAIQGIKAMTKPTILIGGGYDKQNEYDEWIEAFNGKVKLLVLIGQTREKIAKCASAHGFQEYVFADTFEEAMILCRDSARVGDAVLLSPACASWGMFPNYEERGRQFKEFVNNLP